MMIIIIIYLPLLYFSVEALNQVAKVKPLWLAKEHLAIILLQCHSLLYNY